MTEQRRRPVRITAQTEQTLRRQVELHNRATRLTPRASLEVLKVVYTRGAATPANSGVTGHSTGMARVRQFLSALSHDSSLSTVDADLFPSRVPRGPLWDAALTASALGLDDVRSLLARASVSPTSDPSRAFFLNRALALVAGANPTTRAALEDPLRALVADGNSRIARSLRAKRQLRDRKGRWIEMGRGVRFKVRHPGMPGGGQWFHGTVEGIDVPNGRVDVRLEDGRLVKVPNNKLEQPKAILGLKTGGPAPEAPNAPGPDAPAGGRLKAPVPAPDASEPEDPDAPMIARLDEVHEPVNQAAGPVADSIDLHEGLDDAAAELRKRVKDDSSEARSRDQVVNTAEQVMNQWKGEEITKEEAISQLNDVADYADEKASSGDISDDEKAAFQAYSEDVQDLIAAAKDDPEVARLPGDEPAAQPAPAPAAPAPAPQAPEFNGRDVAPSDMASIRTEQEVKLSGAERNAIIAYRMPDDAIAINEALRAGKPLDDPNDEYYDDDPNYYQDINDQMQAVADRTVLAEDLNLWRGLATDENLQPGAVLSQRGWSSVSVSKDIARNFAGVAGREGRAEGGRPTLLEIQTPAGSHLVNTVHEDVGEMIFPPNTQFQVVSVDDSGDVRQAVVRVTGIGDPNQQQHEADLPEDSIGAPDPADAGAEAPVGSELEPRMEMREANVAAYGQLIPARILEAFDGDKEIGHLWFRKDGGEIESVSVLPEYQRRGVATKLFEHANERAAAEGFDPPQHSENLTEAGAAFVRSFEEARANAPESDAAPSRPDAEPTPDAPAPPDEPPADAPAPPEPTDVPEPPAEGEFSNLARQAQSLADELESKPETQDRVNAIANVLENVGRQFWSDSLSGEESVVALQAIENTINSMFADSILSREMTPELEDTLNDFQDDVGGLRKQMNDWVNAPDPEPTPDGVERRDPNPEPPQLTPQEIDEIVPPEAEPDVQEPAPEAEAPTPADAEQPVAEPDAQEPADISAMLDAAIAEHGRKMLLADDIKSDLENIKTQFEAGWTIPGADHGAVDWLDQASETMREDFDRNPDQFAGYDKASDDLAKISEAIKASLSDQAPAAPEEPADPAPDPVPEIDPAEPFDHVDALHLVNAVVAQLDQAGPLGEEASSLLASRVDAAENDSTYNWAGVAEEMRGYSVVMAMAAQSESDQDKVAQLRLAEDNLNRVADYLDSSPALSALPAVGHDSSEMPIYINDFVRTQDGRIGTVVGEGDTDGLEVQIDGNEFWIPADQLHRLDADEVQAEGEDSGQRGVSPATPAPAPAPAPETPETPEVDAPAAADLAPDAQAAAERLRQVMAEAGHGDLARQVGIPLEIFSPHGNQPRRLLDRALAAEPDADGNVEIPSRARQVKVNQADLKSIDDYLNSVADEWVANVQSQRPNPLSDVAKEQALKTGRTRGVSELENHLRATPMQQASPGEPSTSPEPDLGPEPSAPDVPEVPKDQFGNEIPPGFNLTDTRNVRGQPVQVYRFDDPENMQGFTVEAGLVNGAPKYVVYPNFGPRRAGAQNVDSWTDVPGAMSEMRAAEADRRAGDQGRRDEEIRQRAAQDVAEAIQRGQARAAHEDRVQRNVDDANRPLPEGWTREQTPDGHTMYRAAGRYAAVDDPAGGPGSLVLLHRENYGFAQVGPPMDGWDEVNSRMAEDRLERAQQHRDTLAQFLQGHGFSNEAVDAVTHNPDPAAVRDAVRADPEYQRMQELGERAQGADLRQRHEVADENAWNEINGLLENLDPIPSPAEAPLPGEQEPDAINIGGDVEALLRDALNPQQFDRVMDLINGAGQMLPGDRANAVDSLVESLDNADGLSADDRAQVQQVIDALDVPGDDAESAPPAVGEAPDPEAPAPAPGEVTQAVALADVLRRTTFSEGTNQLISAFARGNEHALDGIGYEGRAVIAGRLQREGADPELVERVRALNATPTSTEDVSGPEENLRIAAAHEAVDASMLTQDVKNQVHTFIDSGDNVDPFEGEVSGFINNVASILEAANLDPAIVQRIRDRANVAAADEQAHAHEVPPDDPRFNEPSTSPEPEGLTPAEPEVDPAIAEQRHWDRMLANIGLTPEAERALQEFAEGDDHALDEMSAPVRHFVLEHLQQGGADTGLLQRIRALDTVPPEPAPADEPPLPSLESLMAPQPNADAPAAEAPLATWERELLGENAHPVDPIERTETGADDAVVDPEAPAAPVDPLIGRPRPAAPPGAPADKVTKYHVLGVIRDRNGGVIHAGLRVRSVRDGQEGIVVAVQEQPAYARIEWPDGRRQVRAGRQLLDVDPRPANGVAPAAPAAPDAPAAPAVPNAPAAPAPVDANALAQRLDAVVDMHRAGAGQGFPLDDDVVAARSQVERAMTALRAGDLGGAQARLANAIEKYDDGFGGAAAGRNPQFKADVQRRRDAVKAIHDEMTGVGAANEAHVNEGAAQALEGIRAQVEPRIGARAAGVARLRNLRNGGLAVGDAIEALRRGDRRAAGLQMVRGERLFRNNGRPDLADGVAAVQGGLVPGAGNAPGAPAAPEGTDQSLPIMPGDFLEPRFPNNRATRAESLHTPGVQDPRIERNPNDLGDPDQIQVPVLNPNAEQKEFNAWGARAGEIVGAARTRPKAADMFGMNSDDLRAAVISAYGVQDTGVTYGEKGYRLKLVSVSGGRNSITAEFSVLNDNGISVGKSTRVLSKDGQGVMTAYNSFLKTSAKGGGFASGFNRYMENWYIANGFKEVTVSAAGGGGYTGGFVWAINGFGWNPTSGSGKSQADSKLRSFRGGDTAVKAQVAALKARNDAGDVPTPMEIALVGWRPGMGGKDSWAGKTLMEGKSWGGRKTLKPSDFNQHQRMAYDFAKQANDRVKGNVNVISPMDENLGNFLMLPSKFKDLNLSKAERKEFAALVNGNQSVALLSPRAKRRIANWAGDRIRKNKVSEYPGMARDMAEVRRRVMDDLGADYPVSESLGIGDALRDIGLREMLDNNNPDWDFRALERNVEGGVNATFLVTHKATGQVFFMKNDTTGDSVLGIRGVSRNSEKDVNTLFRRMGFAGMGVNEPSRVEDSMVVMERAADNLNLVSRPQNFGKLNRDVQDEALGNLANPEDALKMLLADALGGNVDRHYNNYQVAKDRESKWWVFPIDHGLWGAGAGWQWADSSMPGSFILNRLMNPGRSKIYTDGVRKWAKSAGREQVTEMVTELLARYRQAVALGEFADPSFSGKMNGKLDQAERTIDEIVNAIIGR